MPFKQINAGPMLAILAATTLFGGCSSPPIKDPEMTVFGGPEQAPYRVNPAQPAVAPRAGYSVPVGATEGQGMRLFIYHPSRS